MTAAPELTFQIQLTGMSKTMIIDVPLTTADLTHLVEIKLGIPHGVFALYHKSRPLRGLSGLSHGSLVELKIRGRGGGCGSSKVSAECHTQIKRDELELDSPAALPVTSITKEMATRAALLRRRRLDACVRYPKPSLHKGDKIILLQQNTLIDANIISVDGSTATAKPLGDESSLPPIALNTTPHTTDLYVDSANEYYQYREAYLVRLRKIYGVMEDGITGVALRTSEHLINISIHTNTHNISKSSQNDGLQYADYALAKDVGQIAKLTGSAAPAPMLLVAAPGTGKTWSATQLLYLLATDETFSRKDHFPFVPLLVTVQELAKLARVRENAELKMQTIESNTVLAFLRQLKDKSSDLPSASNLSAEDFLLLSAAYSLRLLVLIVDGIDEAPALKNEIQQTLHMLVRVGICVIATSRPEGVDVEEWKDSFVLASLGALSDEQQQQLVRGQLSSLNAGREFFDNLSKFTMIRKEHERIYKEAFPDERERQDIELFEAPDLLFKDGARDGNIRLRSRDGKFCSVRKADELSSTYLQQLNGVLTSDVLAAIDRVIKDDMLPPNYEQVIEGIVRPFLAEDKSSIGGKVAVGVAIRLAQLLTKRREALSPSSRSMSPRDERALEYLRKNVPQTTAVTLWPQILARTDQIYETIEDLLPVFKRVVALLIEDVHMDPEQDLTLAPHLKDPVRMHEKALDDYLHDFSDWNDDVVVPETCLMDILRGSVMCTHGADMRRLLERISKGFEVEVDGGHAKLSLLRCKNLFADGGTREPVRFRRMNVNLVLQHNGITMITELQIHHRAIFEFNHNADAHGPYEFFRSRLADMYEKDMDTMLERTIAFLEETSGVPVLLSMLVLIFKHHDAHIREPLPATRLTLYKQAIDATLKGAHGQTKAQLLHQMLCHVAVSNHMAKQRHFGTDLVQGALTHASDASIDISLWMSSTESAAGIPLIKTLEVDALFQFKHISFQEAFFAMAVIEGTVSQSEWNFLNALEDPFYENVFRIGGSDLLAAALCSSSCRELSLSSQSLTAVLPCLPDAIVSTSRVSTTSTLEIISFDAKAARGLHGDAIKTIAACVSKSAPLREIRLGVPVEIGTTEVRILSSACVARVLPCCLIGDVPVHQYGNLRDADAVLIAATLHSFLPENSDQRVRLGIKVTEARMVNSVVELDGVPLAQVAGPPQQWPAKLHQLPPSSHLKLAGYCASELRAAGVSARSCKDAGFPLLQMYQQYSVEELAQVFSPKELREGGLSARECLLGKVAVKEAGFSANQCCNEGLSAAECKAAGFSASELKGGGFKLQDLQKGGYGARDLLDARFSIPQLMVKCNFTTRELHEAGASASMLFEAGESTPSALKAAGCLPADVKAAGNFTKEQMEAGGFVLNSAKQMKMCGFKAVDCTGAGYQLSELREAGYKLSELREAGHKLSELREAGYKLSELREAGYQLSELREAGYKVSELIEVSDAVVTAFWKKVGISEAQIGSKDVAEWHSKNLIDEDCKVLAFLVASGALANLTILNLQSNKIGDAGMKIFSETVASGALANLTKLSLWGNQIGDEGIKAFSTALASGALANLTKLNLGVNKIGVEGIKAFSSALASGALANLTKLYLGSNQIGDEGIKVFSSALASGALANLTELYLRENQIGVEGIKTFSDALARGALAKLTDFYIDGEHMKNPRLVAACKPRGINIK